MNSKTYCLNCIRLIVFTNTEICVWLLSFQTCASLWHYLWHLQFLCPRDLDLDRLAFKLQLLLETSKRQHSPERSVRVSRTGNVIQLHHLDNFVILILNMEVHCWSHLFAIFSPTLKFIGYA